MDIANIIGYIILATVFLILCAIVGGVFFKRFFKGSPLWNWSMNNKIKYVICTITGLILIVALIVAFDLIIVEGLLGR